MTLLDISSEISFLTKSDTTSYPNTDRLININGYYRNVVAFILKSHDGWNYDDSNRGDLPILTNSLVASQQDYVLPTSALQIRRVEISYDGSTWRRAAPFDLSSRERPTDTADLGDFTVNAPFYDIQYGSLFLYPIPAVNVTGGIKIWVERGPSEFTLSDLTTGSKEPGFDSLFHNLLVFGPAYAYASVNNLPNKNDLKSQYDELMALLMNHYGDKNKDLVGSIQGDNQNYK